MPSPEPFVANGEGEPLRGRLIALPETRELDVLGALLTRRGAEVLRCPLVSILDTPNTAAVEAWLKRFANDTPDDFIVFTGEGLRRLMGFAERFSLAAPFLEALARCRKLTRGPKPAKVLREWDLVPDMSAEAPTTEGIIRTLDGMSLTGRRISVQLYGSDPNERLRDYLEGRDVAVDYVAPYVYASESDDTRVRELIDALLDRRVDAIAFTSAQQVKRLLDVAGAGGQVQMLKSALNRLVVAAVGPVVVNALKAEGIEVGVAPESSFFMKPMVTALGRALGPAAGK